jgi:transposase
MIDSTIVRAHQHSAGAQKKTAKTRRSESSKGGLSTKIHAIVDALGNPTALFLTRGQAHDLKGAYALLPHRRSRAWTSRAKTGGQIGVRGAG